MEILLWEDGAPLAAGDGPEDRPALFHYPAVRKPGAAEGEAAWVMGGKVARMSPSASKQIVKRFARK